MFFFDAGNMKLLRRLIVKDRCTETNENIDFSLSDPSVVGVDLRDAMNIKILGKGIGHTDINIGIFSEEEFITKT